MRSRFERRHGRHADPGVWPLTSLLACVAVSSHDGGNAALMAAGGSAICKVQLYTAVLGGLIHDRVSRER